MIALTLTGTCGDLLDYVVFGDWIFFGLAAAAIYVVASSVVVNPANALRGSLLLALGVPVFLFWRRRSPGQGAGGMKPGTGAGSRAGSA